MSLTLDPAIAWSGSLALALLLAVAAGHKLRDLARFRSVLAEYRMVPTVVLPAVAVVVIGSEVAAAALLMIVPLRSGGAALAAGLLVGYALALGLNLLRGRTRLDCGCLGFGRSSRIAWWMVGRNLGLAAVALVTALPPSSRPLEALDLVTIGGAVLTAALLYAAFTRLGAIPLGQGGGS